MTNVTMLTGKSCSNCEMLKKVLKHLKIDDKVEYVDVEGEKGSILLSELGLRSIPVLVRLDDGKPVGTLVGLNFNDKKLVDFVNGND